MKTKIITILSAAIILFFTASELTAVEDKIFTSSGQILDGEEWENVYIYNDDTIVDMLGGTIDGIATYDASTVNVTGGHVNTLEALEFSSANISGGSVYGVFTWDHATTALSTGGNITSLGAGGELGTVNMSGGTTVFLRAGDSGIINLYGGNVTNYLNAWDSATVNIFGYNFNYDPVAGSWGGGQLTGFWNDDTAFTIDLYGSETYSHINLVSLVNAEIEILPETLNLASKGKWISCKIWLPEEYDVADVNSSSVFLEDEVQADWLWFNEKQNVVMAKFPQSEIAEILEPGDVELTVAGYLMDGSYFVGTDTIKVINKGHKNK